MADMYSEVTNKIIQLIEDQATSNSISWAKLSHGGLPMNLSTGKAYQGVNVLLLWVATTEHGFTSPYWLTFKQASAMGGKVKKGSTGTRCVFFKIQESRTDFDAEGNPTTYPVLSPFTVFNLDQIEGIEAPQVVELPGINGQIDAAERLLTYSGATIIEEGDKAFFRPSTDEIYLPTRPQFSDLQKFYAVAFHEITHWTGGKTRLARDKSKRFGDETYAFEELIAELGAAFCCSTLGWVSETAPGHAHYIQSWLKVLKSDKRAIFTAASAAQRAFEYLNKTVEANELAAREAITQAA